MTIAAEIWTGMISLLLALGAFAVYRGMQRRHVLQVDQWIKEYLWIHYGERPEHLNINCSEDRRCPVLVSFDRPQFGTRHRIQFMCPGSQKTLALLSQTEERRSP